MATAYNATNYAKGIDPSSANILDPGTFSGKVRVMQDTYTGAVVATADYIRVGTTLPTGATIVKVKLATSASTGSGNFVTVGDEGDADRYITSISTSGSIVQLDNAYSGMNYTVTGTTDNIIRITSGGTSGAAPLSGGTLKVTVFYTVE